MSCVSSMAWCVLCRMCRLCPPNRGPSPQPRFRHGRQYRHALRRGWASSVCSPRHRIGASGGAVGGGSGWTGQTCRFCALRGRCWACFGPRWAVGLPRPSQRALLVRKRRPMIKREARRGNKMAEPREQNQRTALPFGRAEGVGGNKRGAEQEQNRPSHPTQKRNTAPLRRALRLGGEQGRTGRIDGPQAASTAQNGPLRACAAPSPALSGGRFLRRGGVVLGVFFFFCGGRPSPHTLHGKNFGKFFCQR